MASIEELFEARLERVMGYRKTPRHDVADEPTEPARGHHMAQWFPSANDYRHARRRPEIEEWRRVGHPTNLRVRIHSTESVRAHERLVALETEVARLKRLEPQMARLRAEVESLRSLLGLNDNGETAEVHPGLRWLEEHSEVLLQYRGKEIAIDPRQGVVAVAESLSELHLKLQQSGLLGKVLIESVPEIYSVSGK